MTAPLVVISAAMAVPSGYYRPLVEAFAYHGWEAHTMPTRGFERDTPRASRQHDWSYATEVDAIARVVAAARAEKPDRPIVLLGHSLGAQLGAMHELHRCPSDAFVTVGAGVPHYKSYPYGGVLVLAMGLSVPIATRLFGFVPKPLFGAPGARTLMRQWAQFVRTGTPPFDVPHLIETPALVIKLQADALAVSAANEEFVRRFLVPSTTTRWTYHRSDVPEGGTTDHLAWVKRPDVVVDRIVAWFEAR